MKITTTLYGFITEKVKQRFNDNFWKWFGNSITIDNNNVPLIFYHGTNKSKLFSIFNNNKPIWFTKFKGYAEAISPTNKIFEVYLKIENPINVGNIDNEANETNLKHLSDYTGISIKTLVDILEKSEGNKIYDITNSVGFKEIIENQGYDSIVAIEGYNLTTYAVFNSKQIKSVNNNGNYNKTDDNINN